MSEEEQKDFTAKKLNAKEKYLERQNEACLEAYTVLNEEYNLPICDYYIAKVMFRMGMFSQAKEMFLSYFDAFFLTTNTNSLSILLNLDNPIKKHITTNNTKKK